MELVIVTEDINLNKNIDKIDEYLRNLIPFGFSGTVLIAQGDEILLEEGYGYRNYEENYQMKKDTIMSIGSISKQFTSTIIMQLVDQGKLDVEDTLSKFFDVPEDKEGITIHQLMTHTSGIQDHFGHDFEYMETDIYLEKVFGKNVNSLPGTQFMYSNSGYTILAMIIQKIIGDTYQKYLIKEVFKPLGIIQSGWFGDKRWNDENSTNYYLDGNNTGSIASWEGSHDKPYWAILGNGGVCISNKDLFKWIRAVMTSKIVSKSSLNKMLTPEKENYGYGWDLLPSPLGRLITHDGGNNIGVNAVIKYYEELELTIIINSNVILNGFGMAFKIRNILDELLVTDEISLPPVTSKYGTINEGIYEQGENYIEVSTNLNNQKMVSITGQKILSVFHNHKIPIKIAEQCNYKVNKIAKAMSAKRWEEAFSDMKDPKVSERLVNILEELTNEFEKQYGQIKNYSVSGTSPMSDYYAFTHLMIVGENGSNGLTIVWENENSILGFRRKLIPFPLILQAAFAENDIIVYDIGTGRSMHMRQEDENTMIIDSVILKKRTS